MELDKQESTPSKKKSKYFLICEVRKNKKNKNKDKEKKGKKYKEKKKKKKKFSRSRSRSIDKIARKSPGKDSVFNA